MPNQLNQQLPRGSCTVSNCHVDKTMPNQLNSWVRDLFQTNFFLQGCISKIFFYRDENQNWPKLQGRLSYLSLIFNNILHSCDNKSNSYFKVVVSITMYKYVCNVSAGRGG